MLEKTERLLILQHLPHTESLITAERLASESIEVKVVNGEASETYYVTDIDRYGSKDKQVYLFPFLLNQDGTPWHTANLFLLSLATDDLTGYTNTKGLRRKAAMLLDYKVFCETQVNATGDLAPIDLFDFKHALKSKRPTWRYFSYLTHESGFSPELINSKTNVVYQFYKFAARLPNPQFDIERVETLTNFSIYKNDQRGTIKFDVEHRSQTVRTAESKPVEVHFVRDEGEDLRPLQDEEFIAFWNALKSDVFAQDERLIQYFAVLTGERKQTILTLRRKHLKYFVEKNLTKGGCYRLLANPGNGCDTKFNKPHTLLVPRRLAEMLIVWDKSPIAAKRRKKFAEQYGNVLSEDDMYLFLSPTGDCRYMSKTDPRYIKTMSPATGQITRHLKTKLFNVLNGEISSDFTFHWLRATFALRAYRHCQRLVAEGKMESGSELDYLRYRLHHSKRETTENYLKLFSTVNERIAVQELYEDSLFRDMFAEIGY